MEVFHCKCRNQSCSSAEVRSSPPTANSGTKAAFYQGWIGAVASRCVLHPTLFSIWTVLKRSEKIPGAPTWRWGKWIWLTGPSGLHRNSPHGLNISSIRVLTTSEIWKSQSRLPPGYYEYHESTVVYLIIEKEKVCKPSRVPVGVTVPQVEYLCLVISLHTKY